MGREGGGGVGGGLPWSCQSRSPGVHGGVRPCSPCSTEVWGHLAGATHLGLVGGVNGWEGHCSPLQLRTRRAGPGGTCPQPQAGVSAPQRKPRGRGGQETQLQP